MFFLFCLLVVGLVIGYKFFESAGRNPKNEHPFKSSASGVGLSYRDGDVPVLHGQYENRSVEVKESMNGGRTWTRFRMRYRVPMSLEFDAYPQASGVEHPLDIITGDAGFDEDVILIGIQEEEISDYFENRNARTTVRRFVNHKDHERSCLSGRKLFIEIPRAFDSAAEIRQVLRSLLNYVKQMEEVDRQYQLSLKQKQPPPLPYRKPDEPVVEPEPVVVVEEAEPLPLKEVVFQPPVVEAVPEPVEPPHEPVIEEEPIVEETPPVVEVLPVEEKGLSKEDAWKWLVGDEPSHYQANQQFNELLKDEKIQWNVKLESLSSTKLDRHFAQQTGWVANFECAGSSPNDALNLIYRLGDDQKEAFENRAGSFVAIKGKLVKYDSFTKTLYIDSGDTVIAEKSERRSYTRTPITSYAEKLEKEKRLKA